MLFLVFFGLLLGSSFLVLLGLRTLRSASQNFEAGNWSQREHRGPILALSSSAWCCSACMELEHTSRQMSLILICLWRLKQLNIPKRLFRKTLFTSLHCVCPQNMTRLSFWNSKTCDLCMLLHFQSCSRDCPLLLTCKALEFSAWGWSLNSEHGSTDKNDSLSSLASFHGVLKRYWLLWLTLG